MTPVHPRLAAHAVVLRRGPSLQVGIDPDRALVIENPPEGMAELLGSINGHHPVRSLTDRARRLGVDWPTLERTLRSRALLAESGPPRPSRVEVFTADSWGVAVADTLLAEAEGQVSVVLLDDGADLLRQARQLTTRYRGRVLVHHQWSAPRLPGAVAIIDTGTAETDRAISASCAHHDISHLLVRPTGDGIVVGPLVVPGATPCLNCLDLQARQADPQWPELLMQLSRVRLPAPDLARNWAAATVVSEVLAFQRTGRSALLGRTGTLGEPGWTPHWRPWRVHPGCLCHWDGLDVGSLMTAA